MRTHAAAIRTYREGAPRTGFYGDGSIIASILEGDDPDLLTDLNEAITAALSARMDRGETVAEAVAAYSPEQIAADLLAEVTADRIVERLNAYSAEVPPEDGNNIWQDNIWHLPQARLDLTEEDQSERFVLASGHGVAWSAATGWQEVTDAVGVFWDRIPGFHTAALTVFGEPVATAPTVTLPSAEFPDSKAAAEARLYARNGFSAAMISRRVPDAKVVAP